MDDVGAEAVPASFFFFISSVGERRVVGAFVVEVDVDEVSGRACGRGLELGADEVSGRALGRGLEVASPSFFSSVVYSFPFHLKVFFPAFRADANDSLKVAMLPQ